VAENLHDKLRRHWVKLKLFVPLVSSKQEIVEKNLLSRVTYYVKAGSMLII